MKVSRYLKEGQVLLDLKATEKEGVIKELANSMRGVKEIADFGAFLKDVFEREKLGTTGIGNGIAIPHARTKAVREFVIAFGRSKGGVEFGSIDNQPTRLIFLLTAPREEMGRYLMMLAHLTKVLKEKSFRDSLLKATSPKEIIEEFKRIEE